MRAIPPHIAITYQPKSVYELGKRGVPSARPSTTISPDTCKPMTQPLSPAAKAVMESTAAQVLADRRVNLQHITAAALRAAADNAPAPHHHEEMAFHSGFWAGIEYIRSIATELEGK